MIGRFNQLSGMPRKCCQTNTDRPNAPEYENATVPTMTSAATTLLVISSITRKIRANAAIAAIRRSVLVASWMSQYVAAAPPR
ncbi:Uncharacterised protein [Mycobacteroides abscessus subsp. massiliense]|nr:Uncharacterised protein [Mycobacteroides abscessus subsp. massiliense]